jgi:hypothetical protein
MRTVSVWSGGALPCAHALLWWIAGVPIEKVEQAAQGSSPWDRMTERDRRLYTFVTGGCVAVILIAVVVVVLARD